MFLDKSHEKFLNIILPVKGRGDALSRFLVNFEEMRKSLKLKMTIAVHEESMVSTKFFLEERYLSLLESGVLQVVPCFQKPFSRAGNVSLSD